MLEEAPPKLNAGALDELELGLLKENPEKPPLPEAGAAEAEPKAEPLLPPNALLLPELLAPPKPKEGAGFDAAASLVDAAGLPNEKAGAAELPDADGVDEEEPKLKPVEKGFGLAAGAPELPAAVPKEKPAGDAFGEVPEPKDTVFGGDEVDGVLLPNEKPAKGFGGAAFGASFFSAAGSGTVSTCRRGEGCRALLFPAGMNADALPDRPENPLSADFGAFA